MNRSATKIDRQTCFQTTEQKFRAKLPNLIALKIAAQTHFCRSILTFSRLTLLQTALVFNLYPFEKTGLWLPNAFLVSLDERGKLAHVKQKAVLETLESWGFSRSELVEKCFAQLEKLAPRNLEIRFSPPKAKRPLPLSELFEIPETKRVVEKFAHRELDVLLCILRENNLFLTLDAARKVIAAELVIEFADDLRPHFFFQKTADGLRYQLKIGAENEPAWLPRSREAQPISSEPGWLLVGQRLHFLVGFRGGFVRPFLNKDWVEVKRPSMRDFFEKIIRVQVDQNEFERLEIDGFAVSLETRLANCRLELIRLPLADEAWVFKPTFIYGDSSAFFFNEKRAHRTQLSFLKNGDISLQKTARDAPAEAHFIQILRENGLVESGSQTFQLIENQLFTSSLAWLSEKTERLAAAGFEVVAPEIDGQKISLAVGKIHLQSRRENDWFDLFGEVEIGEFRIPFGRLLSHIRTGERTFKLPDGTFWPIPDEWFSRYEMAAFFGKEIREAGSKSGGDGFRLSNLHAGLTAFFLKNADSQLVESEEVESGLEADFSPTLPGLNAQLYPYQADGLRWLIRHFYKNTNALLADEMGLGKTLQTIALLLFAKRKRAENRAQNAAQSAENQTDSAAFQLDLFGPAVAEIQATQALVVAPASLVFNWEREIRRFAPEFFIYRHVGGQRNRSARDLAGQDIVLTTYQTALSDADLLAKIDWEIIVLDEAHFVKNRLSETAKSLRGLRARHKIALTGTPIENRLADLFAQMEWLNPDLLGSAAFFQTHFAGPIERGQSPQRTELLRQLVGPFILRRTKKQVAIDLPQLTEKFIFPEMTASQRALYEREKAAARNLLAQPDALSGLNYGRQILPALLRLRQLACHPVLVKKWSADFSENDELAAETAELEVGNLESGKFPVVLEMWREVAEAGHKVLIFSNFVEHLRLFKHHFEAENEPIAWLTGESSQAERARAVDDFSNNPSVKIMLSSLKAGGVGLNLTAADYVFLLDPWWNPAAERQAISRAHRGGQTQPVVALRFVCRDSIEEKIMDLQRRKEQLFSDLLDFEREPTRLERADLEFLLG